MGTYIGNIEIKTPQPFSDVLDSLRTVFRGIKRTGDSALAQVDLQDMLRVPAPEMNSIAVIVQHLHGNMLSRWTDFLTSDGEKPWRERDAEFEAQAFTSRDEVLKFWEDGWTCVLRALDSLAPGDLLRTVTIRGQAHSVLEAAHRQLQHYSYHIGQIVLLAHWARGEKWQTLSIARGKSKEYAPRGIAGEPKI